MFKSKVIIFILVGVISKFIIYDHALVLLECANK